MDKFDELVKDSMLASGHVRCERVEEPRRGDNGNLCTIFATVFTCLKLLQNKRRAPAQAGDPGAPGGGAYSRQVGSWNGGLGTRGHMPLCPRAINSDLAWVGEVAGSGGALGALDPLQQASSKSGVRSSREVAGGRGDREGEVPASPLKAEWMGQRLWSQRSRRVTLALGFEAQVGIKRDRIRFSGMALGPAPYTGALRAGSRKRPQSITWSLGLSSG